MSEEKVIFCYTFLSFLYKFAEIYQRRDFKYCLNEPEFLKKIVFNYQSTRSNFVIQKAFFKLPYNLQFINQLNCQINSGQPTRGGVQEPNQNPYHPSQGGSFVAR